jgi:hypothetical protein
LTSAFPIFMPFISFFCLIALAKNSHYRIRVLVVDNLVSFLILTNTFSILIQYNIECMSFKHSFHYDWNSSGIFIMKAYWILLKAFSASIERLCDFSLFAHCIAFTDFHTLKHACIPIMKPI